MTMWQFILLAVYPLSAFVFIRLAIRCFAAWAVRPRIVMLLLGTAFSALTIHTGSHLVGLTVVSPMWWVQWLVIAAFGYVLFKNIKEIWQFESIAR